MALLVCVFVDTNFGLKPWPFNSCSVTHVFCGLTTSGFQQGFGADAHIFIASLKPARSMLTRSQQGMLPAATLPFPVMLVSYPPGDVAVPCHDWLKRLFNTLPGW
jgi:hypothetical protein